MLHEGSGETARIIKILDERSTTRQKGTGKDYLVVMENVAGKRKERWIPERKLAAGDLLFQYRREKQAKLRATINPRTENDGLEMIAVISKEDDKHELYKGSVSPMGLSDMNSSAHHIVDVEDEGKWSCVGYQGLGLFSQY